MINVSKPYLPPLYELERYLQGIWERSCVTNHGPLVCELEQRLQETLNIPYVLMVSSGTMALQIALRALNLSGEIITTPFSHVSTVNAILWNHCKPVFADIEPRHFCIDPACIEALVNERTVAIVATHVYGYPCQVEKIRAIAGRYNLPVVYDGAHAFGVDLDGRPLLERGDISAVSFHATKVFHTVEGGAVITANRELYEQCGQLRNFGISENLPVIAGINGKSSELHAAVGLCNLPHLPALISRRRHLTCLYRSLLQHLPLYLAAAPSCTDYNYAYLPVLFNSEGEMLAVFKALALHNIHPRRYFYPSLNTLAYLKGESCPVSEDVSRRILSLPLYHDLADGDVHTIAGIVGQQLMQMH